MNILLLPCHSILEYDEMKLFAELGHNVFSLGSYIDPAHPHDPKRPPIATTSFPELAQYANEFSKENLHDSWIAWADIIIVHHKESWIINNWYKIKHKRVVWRTIGQSVPYNEMALKHMRSEGLQIVRYSPKEHNIPEFIGEDVMIRFYKDPEEYRDWNGNDVKVIDFIQDVPNRRQYVNYDAFLQATDGLNRKLFGPNNGTVMDMPNGGVLSYDELKREMRDSRVFFYTGTQPASYTLGFMEAWMTGIPIVAIGPRLANSIFKFDLYEVNSLIESGKSGFVCDEISELQFYTKELLTRKDLADQISAEGRRRAIEVFGKETIKQQWKTFLEQ